jgi:osmotically-inducible protein OsmY
MNIPSKRRTLILCAYVGAAACGLAGFTISAGAQNATEPPASRSDAVAASAMSGSSASADEDLREHVQTALHADPYFYDQHVTVSVDKGAVVLRGFVFSDWDLQEAIRIAGQAAGHRRVIDDLSIQQGGRR